MKLQKIILITTLFIIQFLPRRMLFVLVLFFWGSLHSVTWEVKQDSTGNFTEIQTAIDASTNGDTVLVYPGRYYENINLNGKSITLGSLYLITPADSLIKQTIIDGNRQGRVVTINSGESVVISGLSMCNGFMNEEHQYGAGVLIDESELDLIFCIIEENVCKNYGGGVTAIDSFVEFEGVTVKNNFAGQSGGGFAIANSESNFEPSNRCNIYNNFASSGADVYYSNENIPLNLYVDTLTVTNYDEFFLSNYHDNNGIIDILNSKLEPINADFYVSPDGDDDNDGLTAETPFKTIRKALINIQPNSENPNTIYLLPGIYSHSTNGELLPVTFRYYTNIQGTEFGEVIIDGENESPFFNSRNACNINLKNLILYNGNGNEIFSSVIKATRKIDEPNRFFNLENIKFINENDYVETGLLEQRQMNFSLKNIDVSQAEGTYGFFILNTYDQPWTVDVENMIFSNQGSQFHIASQIFSNTMQVNISNSLFSNNEAGTYDWNYGGAALQISERNANVNLVNCTIVDNEWTTSYENGGAISNSGENVDINVYNSIIYGNEPNQIYAFSTNNSVSVDYSLIENGIEGIEDNFNGNNTNWGDNNLSEDPLFDPENPYHLTANSPCVDAGTLELPAGVELPGYDLAGNPRVQGNTIDIGCYESSYTSINPNDVIPAPDTSLSNYPNPFNPSTTISFSIPESGDVKLEIYNIKGQKVKTLVDAYVGTPTYSVQWHGTDDSGKPVSSGQYFAKLIMGDDVVAKKLLLLK